MEKPRPKGGLEARAKTKQRQKMEGKRGIDRRGKTTQLKGALPARWPTESMIGIKRSEGNGHGIRLGFKGVDTVPLHWGKSGKFQSWCKGVVLHLYAKT